MNLNSPSKKNQTHLKNKHLNNYCDQIPPKRYLGLSGSANLRNEEADSEAAADQSAKDKRGFLKKAESESELESDSESGVEDQCRSPRPEPIVIAAAHFRDGMERIMRVRSARQLQRERDILHTHQPKKKRRRRRKSPPLKAQSR